MRHAVGVVDAIPGPEEIGERERRLQLSRGDRVAFRFAPLALERDADEALVEAEIVASLVPPDGSTGMDRDGFIGNDPVDLAEAIDDVVVAKGAMSLSLAWKTIPTGRGPSGTGGEPSRGKAKKLRGSLSTSNRVFTRSPLLQSSSSSFRSTSQTSWGTEPSRAGEVAGSSSESGSGGGEICSNTQSVPARASP
jgi:hypothetical protein